MFLKYQINFTFKSLSLSLVSSLVDLELVETKNSTLQVKVISHESDTTNYSF